jgi:DNA-binding protein HU-beta
MQKAMSKSELIQRVAEQSNLSRSDVSRVLAALEDVGHAELKNTGTFTLPGFVKFVAAEMPATEAHQGINPFTKEPMMIEAKPARKVIRARLLKAMKDAVSAPAGVQP